MTDLYQKKLRNLVEGGRLRIYIVIAPPRTNSSLVEHALGNSPDIEHECHEPFLEARHDDFDSDHGYKQIYESIGGEEFENSGENTTVVVKEMSHWIGKNEEYKRFVTLTDQPIIVLVRNPLLTVESRLRRVISSIDMRCNLDVQNCLLDEFSVEKGFRNWDGFAEEMKRSGYGNREDLDFLQNKEGIERISTTPILTVQNSLLDRKARKNGYANWRDLIEKKLHEECDYIFFEEILKANIRRTVFEENEFQALSEEVDYFEEQGRVYLVLDTTDLRALPEKQMQRLCTELEIRYSPEMVRWGEEPVDFHTEQKKQFEKIWYDTLHSSSRVNPPIEIPPTIDQFPESMQRYLRVKNLPIYTHLSKRRTVEKESQRELNEQEFHVKVTKGNKEHLRRLGLIGDEIEIGEKILMKLKYIDPIYAIINEPELVNESGFQTCVDIYKEEMDILQENFPERNEGRNKFNAHEKKHFR